MWAVQRQVILGQEQVINGHMRIQNTPPVSEKSFMEINFSLYSQVFAREMQVSEQRLARLIANMGLPLDAMYPGS